MLFLNGGSAVRFRSLGHLHNSARWLGSSAVDETPGNDAHAVWTDDGKHVMWSSARFGFKDESVLYDDVPQPYAQIFIMKADGSEQIQLTDTRYEEAMPRLLAKTKSLPKGVDTMIQTAKIDH